MQISFKPSSSKCIGCGKYVELAERQEITWDKADNCRRRCGGCIAKLERTQLYAAPARQGAHHDKAC